MQAKDLRPLGQLAQFNGVKCIGYGPAGSGKTPVAVTAPKPVFLAIEPGLLSVRDATIPAWLADTPAKIEEFFNWLFGSHEAKNFDTVVIDSVSEWCELVLQKTMKANSHGLKAYGDMAEEVLKRITQLYYMPQKHMYLICKETNMEEQGVNKLRPYFPGKEVYKEINHKFDLIMHAGLHNVPNAGIQKSFCTNATFDIHARDRSGKLAQFEPMDLSYIFSKAIQ